MTDDDFKIFDSAIKLRDIGLRLPDEELNQKRDEMALNFSSFEPGEELNSLNLRARAQFVGFKAGFDNAVELLRETPSAQDSAAITFTGTDPYKYFLRVSAENERLRGEVNRLTRVIAKELTENDELGSEFVYVYALKAEIEAIKTHYITLQNEAMVERDALKAEVDRLNSVVTRAVETLAQFEEMNARE